MIESHGERLRYYCANMGEMALSGKRRSVPFEINPPVFWPALPDSGLCVKYLIAVTLSAGRVVPAKLIGEQHDREGLNSIPWFADRVTAIRLGPWIGRSRIRHMEKGSVGALTGAPPARGGVGLYSPRSPSR